jgi:hypothetical protein
MEEYSITNSLDWQQVRSRMSKSKGNLGIFKRDIDRLLKGIDVEIIKLGNLEITARNNKSQSSLDRAQAQLDIVNQQIKNFNKFYIMALMTHS